MLRELVPGFVSVGLICAGFSGVVRAQTPQLVLREDQQIQVDAAPEYVLSIDRLAAWGHDSYLVIASVRPWQHEKHIVWGSLNGSTPLVYGVEDGQAPGEPDHFRLRDGLSIAAPAAGSESAVFLGDGEGEGGFLMSLRRGAGELAREGAASPSADPWTFIAAPIGTRNDEVWFLAGTVDEADPDDPKVVHSITTETALYKATPGGITRVIGDGDAVTGLSGTTLIARDAMTRLYDVSDNGGHWIGVAKVAPPSPAPVTEVVLLDGAALVVGGEPVRLGMTSLATTGQAGDAWESFDDLAVNDSGSWALVARVGNGTTSRRVIVIDGNVEWTEGDVLDGTTLGIAFAGVQLNNDGDLAFTGVDIGDDTAVIVLNNRFAFRVGDRIDEDGDGDADDWWVYDLAGGRQTTLSDRNANGHVTLWTRGTAQFLDSSDPPLPITEHPAVMRMTLDPLATGPCPADFDGDGALTIFDFLAFQTAFDSEEPSADFDGDGALTVFDILAFQTAFDAGCS